LDVTRLLGVCQKIEGGRSLKDNKTVDGVFNATVDLINTTNQ